MSERPDLSLDDATHVSRPGRASDIRLDDTPELDGYSVHEVLGSGGIARVRRAKQHALGREVAVKTLHTDSDEERARLAQEARVLGELQHPNILPIHDLKYGPDGQPQLVLKRIEGESWRQLLRQPEKLAERFESSALEWHVRTLIAVTQAVSFAHARGLLHRDINPSNVMIGRFGEVYLLDWGLAASFDARTEVAPPIVRGQVAGTAAYMSPEQWRGEALSPASDVYSLAATLHHAVSGEVLWERLPTGQRRRRALHPSIPQALRPILERALEEAPSRRTASAAAFRRELEGYLRALDSHFMVEQAQESAGRALRAADAGDGNGFEYAAVEAAIMFRTALERCPANIEAQQGELELARLRVERALEAGEVTVASRVLATLPRPPEDLRSRVERAREDADAAAQEIAALRQDQTRAIGLDTRRAMILSLGPIWSAVWLIAAYVGSASWLAAMMFVVALIGSVVVVRTSKTLLRGQMNRLLVTTISSLLVALIVVFVTAAAHGHSTATVAPYASALYFLTCTIATVAIDRRAIVHAVQWAILMGLTGFIPAYGVWFLALGNIGSLFIGMWINARLRALSKEAPLRAPGAELAS